MLSEEWPAVKRRLVAQLPVECRWDDRRSRYVAISGSETLAVIDLEVRGDLATVVHTGTPVAWRGCGLAARLTRFMLEDIRAHGHRIRPLCSYTRAYLAEHPEFADLPA